MIPIALSVAVWCAAGQVSDDGVPLDEVLARTELVVTLQLDTPAMTEVKIPVPSPPGSTKDCGKYEHGAYTGRVVGVVHPLQGAQVHVGERVVVFLASTPRFLAMSTYLCAVAAHGESARVRQFNGATPKDGATLTVLLRWEPDLGWTEAVLGSWLAKPPTPKALAGALKVDPRAFKAKARANDNALCVIDDDCTRTELVCNVCAPCKGAGRPVARAAANRYRLDCFESLGRPPSPCGPCIVEGAPKAVCRNMKCVDEPAPTTPKQ